MPMRMDLVRLCLGVLVLGMLSVSSSAQKQEKFVDLDLHQNHQQLVEPDDFEFQKSVRPSTRPKKGRNEEESDIKAAGSGPATEDADHVAGSPYKFSYGVDDSSGTQFSQKVDSDGEVVTGEYRVLMADGRLQIVTYTADWKNGFRPKYTYEGTARPWVAPARRPATKRPLPDENETDIQPGGFTPKKPTPTFPSKTQPVKQRPTKRPLPNEEEEDIQPGGFTPAPTRRTTSSTRAPVRVTTKAPVRATTKAPAARTTQPPIVRTTRPPTVRTTQPPIVRTTRPPTVRTTQPPTVRTTRPPIVRTTQPPIVRTTRPPTVRTTQRPTVRTTQRPTVRTTKAPVRRITTQRPLIDEGEIDIQSVGFTPKPVDPCAPGTTKALLNPNCRVPNDAKAKCMVEKKDPKLCFPELCFPGSAHPKCSAKRPTRPDENEEDIQPGGYLPKPMCTPYSKDPKCKKPGVNESEEDIQPGGYLPNLKCTPHSKDPKCKKPFPNESEEDIQPGGYVPTTKPVQADPCARGTTKSLLDPNCRMRDAKAKCVAENKDPRVCFPELCFPGSKHAKCQAKPSQPEETEVDIQPGGFTPPPTTPPVKKPSNLYDTPDTPYGVRLNRKFGYE